MLNKNECYEAEITSYGSEGQGVCKIDGIAVFVPYAVVGDHAEVKILKTAKAYAFGKIEKLIKPSKYRVIPACPQYGKCGGCQIMHLSYEEQLKMKRQYVQDCMERIAKSDVKVLPVIGADQTMHYRNKIQIPVGVTAEGEPVCGFYAGRSHRIIPAGSCLLQQEPAGRIIDAVLVWMKKYKISAYDEAVHQGMVRHLFLRSSKVTSEWMVGLVINAEQLPYSGELSKSLKECGVTSFFYNRNQKRTNVILGKSYVQIFGEKKMADDLCGLSYRISPASFYQVNHAQTEKLYETAIKMAQIGSSDTVFDLYCGIGTISLYAAKFAKSVVGVEIVPEAVADAKENAKRNGIQNARFFCGDAGAITTRLKGEGVTANVIIVDPPRKGCSRELIDTITELFPERIVYISCNPATLARDVKILKENGYYINKVQPVDMFIHTSHVECVVCLQRANTL